MQRRSSLHAPTRNDSDAEKIYPTRVGVLLAAMFVSLPNVAGAQEASAAQAERSRVDPWESVNREFYAVGQLLDRVAFRPLAKCYQHWLPRTIRVGVSNALSNLDEPEVGVNDLAQGRPRRAGVAALRFAINTTVGVAGVFDIAKHAGLSHHDNDAGLTLGRYNVASGPYLYVPIVGPSSVRDIIGAGADFLLDPLGWVRFRGSDRFYEGEIAISALDARVAADDDLTTLSRIAVDPYATLRSYYLQSRESLVRDRPLDIGDLPDFPEAPNSPAEPTPPSGDQQPISQ